TLIDAIQEDPHTLWVLKEVNKIANITRLVADKNNLENFYEETVESLEPTESNENNLLWNFKYNPNAKFKLRFAEVDGVLSRFSEVNYRDKPLDFPDDGKKIRVHVDEFPTMAALATRVKGVGAAYNYIAAEHPELLKDIHDVGWFMLAVNKRVVQLRKQYADLFVKPSIQGTKEADRFHFVIRDKYRSRIQLLHEELLEDDAIVVPEDYQNIKDFMALTDQIASALKMVEEKDYDSTSLEKLRADDIEEKDGDLIHTRSNGRSAYSIRDESWVSRPDTILQQKGTSTALTIRVLSKYLENGDITEEETLPYIVNAYYSDPQESSNIIQAIVHKKAGVGVRNTDFTHGAGVVAEQALKEMGVDIAAVSFQKLLDSRDKDLNIDISLAHNEKIKKIAERIRRIQIEISKQGKVGQVALGPDFDLKPLKELLDQYPELNGLVVIVNGKDPKENERLTKEYVKRMSNGEPMILLLAGNLTGGNPFKEGGLDFGATHLTAMRGLDSMTQWLLRAGSKSRVGLPGDLTTWNLYIDLEDNFLTDEEVADLSNPRLSKEEKSQILIEVARQIDAQYAQRSVDYVAQVTYMQATPATMRHIIDNLEDKVSRVKDQKAIAHALNTLYLSNGKANRLAALIVRNSNFVSGNLLTPEGQRFIKLLNAFVSLDPKMQDKIGQVVSNSNISGNMDTLFDSLQQLFQLGVRTQDLEYFRIAANMGLIVNEQQVRDDTKFFRRSEATLPYLERLAARLENSGNVDHKKLADSYRDIIGKMMTLERLANKFNRLEGEFRDEQAVRLAKKMAKQRVVIDSLISTDQSERQGPHEWVNDTFKKMKISQAQERWQKALSELLNISHNNKRMLTQYGQLAAVDVISTLNFRTGGLSLTNREAEKVYELIQTLADQKWLEEQDIASIAAVMNKPELLAEFLSDQVPEVSTEAAVFTFIQTMLENYAYLSREGLARIAEEMRRRIDRNRFDIRLVSQLTQIESALKTGDEIYRYKDVRDLVGPKLALIGQPELVLSSEKLDLALKLSPSLKDNEEAKQLLLRLLSNKLSPTDKKFEELVERANNVLESLPRQSVAFKDVVNNIEQFEFVIAQWRSLNKQKGQQVSAKEYLAFMIKSSVIARAASDITNGRFDFNRLQEELDQRSIDTRVQNLLNDPVIYHNGQHVFVRTQDVGVNLEELANLARILDEFGYQNAVLKQIRIVEVGKENSPLLTALKDNNKVLYLHHDYLKDFDGLALALTVAKDVDVNDPAEVQAARIISLFSTIDPSGVVEIDELIRKIRNSTSFNDIRLMAEERVIPWKEEDQTKDEKEEPRTDEEQKDFEQAIELAKQVLTLV
ncbi:MAG: hypothetical protein KC618_02635, partial [Candidatus Omnitrophica bacterium]|nr:hypothetical protein [Candidatus Omnitrophota bacterium]